VFSISKVIEEHLLEIGWEVRENMFEIALCEFAFKNTELIDLL